MDDEEEEEEVEGSVVTFKFWFENVTQTHRG